MSWNRSIAAAAVNIQALATRLGSVVFSAQTAQEEVRAEDIEHIPGDLQKVVFALLALLDDEVEEEITGTLV